MSAYSVKDKSRYVTPFTFKTNINISHFKTNRLTDIINLIIFNQITVTSLMQCEFKTKYYYHLTWFINCHRNHIMFERFFFILINWIIKINCNRRENCQPYELVCFFKGYLYKLGVIVTAIYKFLIRFNTAPHANMRDISWVFYFILLGK